jgi:uncharacterized glyoxalase superfamily protein PhnB
MGKEASGQVFYPLLVYRDARAAMRFLADAFGFEPALAVPGPGASIVHAQMRFEGAALMLRSVREGEADLRAAADAGFVTSLTHVSVTDVDAVHQRAVRAGAAILQPLADAGDGRRGFTVRDIEGYIWRFDIYRP